VTDRFLWVCLIAVAHSMVMHSPGAMEIQGAMRNASLPSRRMIPHSAVSAGSPSPRKVSALRLRSIL